MNNVSQYSQIHELSQRSRVIPQSAICDGDGFNFTDSIAARRGADHGVAELHRLDAVECVEDWLQQSVNGRFMDDQCGQLGPVMARRTPGVRKCQSRPMLSEHTN